MMIRKLEKTTLMTKKASQNMFHYFKDNPSPNYSSIIFILNMLLAFLTFIC
ncbi:unnamed protein product [Meloidogyne enterolobii]|uniref:Uncharacterized protein n=1 Tax=Meloidogyne enterolobii TaxID=390850 RepID=A0ACB0YAS1_MELEN